MVDIQLRIYYELVRMSLLIRRVKGILLSNIVKNIYQYQRWPEEGRNSSFQGKCITCISSNYNALRYCLFYCKLEDYEGKMT